MKNNLTVKYKRCSSFCVGILNALRSPPYALHGSRRAFTLVEAVLALAILSIGIFVIVEATARCLAVIRVSRNYHTARAALDRYESAHPVSTNSAADVFVQAEEWPPGFRTQRELAAVDGEKKLQIVKTRVTWSESGQASAEEVVSYLYFPNEE